MRTGQKDRARRGKKNEKSQVLLKRDAKFVKRQKRVGENAVGLTYAALWSETEQIYEQDTRRWWSVGDGDDFQVAERRKRNYDEATVCGSCIIKTTARS